MNAFKKILWPALAVLLTVAALAWTNRAVQPRQATWEDVTLEAKRGGYQLITTDELKTRVESGGDLLLVDTRQDWEYRSGAIRDAVNFPMEPTAWSRWKKKDALAELLGPDKNRFIVFY